jgi:hypothetical protein
VKSQDTVDTSALFCLGGFFEQKMSAVGAVETVCSFQSPSVLASCALRTELILRESCEETARLSAVEAAEIDGVGT